MVVNYSYMPRTANAQGDTAFNTTPGNDIANFDQYGNQNNGQVLTDVSNPYGYRGYYGDVESGNYYLSARYYDPTIQRFTQSDTYRGNNPYAYSNGDPVNHTDPSGHYTVGDKVKAYGYGTADSYGGGAHTRSFNGETLTIAKMVSGNGRTRIYGLSQNGKTGSANVIGWFAASQFSKSGGNSGGGRSSVTPPTPKPSGGGSGGNSKPSKPPKSDGGSSTSSTSPSTPSTPSTPTPSQKNCSWALSVGVEGTAAFVFGVYAGIAVNFDSNWNVSITYSIGFTIITNAVASFEGYVAFYPGKSVSNLNGWGVSVGAAFSVGVHVSATGSFDMGFDGDLGGSVSVGYGVGASIAPIPYFQTKIGYTGTFYTFNLKSLLNDWKNGALQTYSTLGVGVTVTKQSNYVNMYIKNFKKTIRLYNNGSMKVL